MTLTPEQKKHLRDALFALIGFLAGFLGGCAAFDLKIRHGGSEVELHTPGPTTQP